MKLTPPDGLLISRIQGYDKDSPVTNKIVASDYDVFTGWQWSISPEPPSEITAEEQDNILEVGWWSPLRYVFPKEFIQFIQPGTAAELKTVSDFASVPKGAEVVRLRPHRRHYYEYTLTVIATGIKTLVPVAATGTYTLRLEHFHDIHRDTLRGLIDASSNSFL